MNYCIIPAYNEAENINKVVIDAKKFVDFVVVIDDCSSDDTVKEVEKIKDKQIVLLKHLINRGQGAALRTGTEYALKNNADIIVHFDADGQFLASEIPDMLAPIQKGEAEIVLGSRFLGKKSNIPWLKKNILFPIGKLVNYLFSGANNLTDPQSGFRAFSNKAAQKIKIEQDRMAHASEILNKILKSNLKYQEVPITVIYNEFGQKFSGGVKIIKELIIGRITNY